MTIKYLNQQNVKALLKTDPGVKTISAEAVQWIDDVVGQVAKNLAASGRKSPSGRLMRPKMDPGLQSRQMIREPERATNTPTPGFAPHENAVQTQMADLQWADYNDWQALRRSNMTKLSFTDWQKEKRK